MSNIIAISENVQSSYLHIFITFRKLTFFLIGFSNSQHFQMLFFLSDNVCILYILSFRSVLKLFFTFVFFM